MAEIKISDLSVGNWVRVINQFNAQIDGYHSESGSLSLKTRQRNLVHYRLEDILPIPLTPEILEKNGFAHHKKSLWYATTENRVHINVWLSKDNMGRIEVCVPSDSSPAQYSAYANIGYVNIAVHQLQHALRLAGVEKEIEL